MGPIQKSTAGGVKDCGMPVSWRWELHMLKEVGKEELKLLYSLLPIDNGVSLDTRRFLCVFYTENYIRKEVGMAKPGYHGVGVRSLNFLPSFFSTCVFYIIKSRIS